MIPNILCIDDDETTLMLNEFLCELTRFSKKVTLVTKADEVIEEFKNMHKEGSFHNMPDLMLLDLNMPVMNGWQFLDALQEIDRDFANQQKIIVLSSSINPKDKEDVRNYPNVIFFQSKPLSEEVFADLKEHPLLEHHFKVR